MPENTPGKNAFPVVPMADIRRFRYAWTALERGLDPSRRFPLGELKQAAIYLVRLRDVAEKAGLDPFDRNCPRISTMVDF